MLKKVDIFRKVLRGKRRKKAKHNISIQIIRTFFPRYSSVLATPWPGMRRRGMARGVGMEGSPVTRCMIRGSWTTCTPILVRLSLQMLLGIYSPTDSLRKHPFLIALHRWGRFARSNVSDSATEIPCWWRKICPESGQKRWLVVTLFQLLFTNSPRETFPAEESEEKRMFSQAIPQLRDDHRLVPNRYLSVFWGERKKPALQPKISPGDYIFQRPF